MKRGLHEHGLKSPLIEAAGPPYAAIIGPNGSVKTTLLKHFNVLLTPASGQVLVSGWDTRDRDRLVDVRRTVGMVFQDPSASVIQSTVREEVAFGPENPGVPSCEIEARVSRTLSAVGLRELMERPCAFLSSGQKQRLAIAAAQCATSAASALNAMNADAAVWRRAAESLRGHMPNCATLR
jgi:energy-coupling factor transporter ATP-binding protein EcfA2